MSNVEYYNDVILKPWQERLDSTQVANFYCALASMVREELNITTDNDCFCGEGGFWESKSYDGSIEKGYKNEGEVAKFIHDAVMEAIARAKSEGGE